MDLTADDFSEDRMPVKKIKTLMAQLREITKGIDQAYLDWLMPFFELMSETMIAVKEDRQDDAYERAREYLKFFLSYLDKVAELYKGEEILQLVILRE